MVGIVLRAGGPAFLEPGLMAWFIALLRWPVLLLLVLGSLALLYRYGPSREAAWRWVTRAAASRRRAVARRVGPVLLVRVELRQLQ